MTDERQFFRVTSDLWHTKLPPHLEQGFETERDFWHALRQLVGRWGGRVGECIDSRHGHLLLRFHDTPGGRPDEAWLPDYLLTAAPMPEYLRHPEEPDETERELDAAFGFD